MVSDIDVKDKIFQHLKGSALEQAVSGVLSKTTRPKDSDKEDIVISILANNCAQLQTLYVNVNIYVKDDVITRDGSQQYEMDIPRCRELCKLAYDALESAVGDGFRFDIESQRVIAVEAIKSHVINNRLFYQNLNE